jgi:hypothetical protein
MEVEDDDDSYVPESLRGVFEDADKKLDQDLADVLDSNNSPRLFVEDEGMSPPLEAPPSTNPAALLTHGAAKDLALEGVTPTSLLDEQGTPCNSTSNNAFAVTNLQSQLDEVAQEVDEDEDDDGVNDIGSSRSPQSTTIRSEVIPAVSTTARPAVTPNTIASSSSQTTPPNTGTSQTSKTTAASSSLTRKGAGSSSRKKGKNKSRGGNNRKVAPVPEVQPDTASSPAVSETPKPKEDAATTGSSSVIELHSGALQLDDPSPPPSDAGDPQNHPEELPAAPSNTAATTTTPDKPWRNDDGPMTTPAPPSVLVQGTPTSQVQLQNPQMVENRHGPDPSPQRPKEISFLPSSEVASPMASPAVAALRRPRNNKIRTPTSWPVPQQNQQKQQQQQSPPISKTSSLLRGTVASRGHTATDATVTTTAAAPSQSSSAPAAVWKGRKELTSPDKVWSRLLRGTSSSRARFSKKTVDEQSAIISKPRVVSKPLPTRLLQPTETVEVHLAESPIKGAMSAEKKKQLEQERLETQARVQDRLKVQQQKDKERKVALQQKMRLRQKEQKCRREKQQASLANAKSKRDKLEEMERERIDKLKKEIEDKETRARLRLAEKEKENQRPSATGGRGKSKQQKSSAAFKTSASRKFKPTIPIAPNFRTDQRIKNHDKTTRAAQDPISMAQSENILKQGLRGETPETRHNNAAAPRQLTIPKGPRLSTSKRHGRNHKETTSTIPMKPKKTPTKHLWETELRGVSSPLASDNRSTSSRLTIPHTPKFHEIKHRPLPKSTAEKETEEMAYFKSHPFKAQPIKMKEAGSVSKTTKPPPKRVVTTPSPFQFRTDQRLSSARRRIENTPKEDGEEGSARVQLFKARPAPKFKAKTPLTGKRSTATTNRSVTTPEPFHFNTVSHRYHKTPQTAGTEKKEPLFKARPMPSFSRPTGLTLQRRVVQKSVEPQESQHNDAFKVVPAETYEWSDAKDKVSEQEEPQFQARPMPKFEKVSIPVKAQQPEKTRSSPIHLVELEPEPEPVPFKALKVPKSLTKPSIPVKQRDPAKLRSPQEVRASPTEKKTAGLSPIDTTGVKHGFHARRAPKRSPPSIPVTSTNPAKLRSPEDLKKADLRSPTKEISPGFKARKLPKSLKKPSIPVKPRDPAKLRSPEEILEKSRQMPTFHQQSGGSPIKTIRIHTTTPTLTPPKWAAPRQETPPKKDTAKDRLRQRLKGRQSNSAAASNGGSSKFASANVRTRLKRVAPVASPEPVAGIPTNIHVSSPDGEINVDAGTTDVADEFHDAYDLTLMAEKAARATVPNTPNTPDEERKRRQVEAAAHEWSRSTTPRAGTGAGPMSSDERRTIQTRETMKMALDLQRAADDELSYHGSNSTSREQFEEGGYIF